MPRGWLVLAAHDSSPVLLSGSAAAIWEVLEEPLPRLEVVRRLAAHFDVEDTAIADDIDAALAELAVRGVLEAPPS